MRRALIITACLAILVGSACALVHAPSQSHLQNSNLEALAVGAALSNFRPFLSGMDHMTKKAYENDKKSRIERLLSLKLKMETEEARKPSRPGLHLWHRSRSACSTSVR